MRTLRTLFLHLRGSYRIRQSIRIAQVAERTTDRRTRELGERLARHVYANGVIDLLRTAGI